MWKHKKKYKGKTFLGTYEYRKGGGKRMLRLKDAKSGKEVGEYGNHLMARRDGWIYTEEK